MNRILASLLLALIITPGFAAWANQPQQPGQSLQSVQPDRRTQIPLPNQPPQPRQPAQPRQPTQPQQPTGPVDPGCIPGNPTHLPQCSSY